jgi:hypothetical protein
MKSAIKTLEREVRELERLCEIWAKDPQATGKKTLAFYENSLYEHRKAIIKITPKDMVDG